jgi:hypothetical protein
MTASGKTGLLIVMVEEALRAGVQGPDDEPPPMVYWSRNCGAWAALIAHQLHRHAIGYLDSEEDASRA